MQMLRTVRRSPREVAEVLSALRRSKRLYLRLRALKPETLPGLERAARFIYLNRYCFNGLYRTNLAGRFNVPYGAEATGSLPSEIQLQRCARLLRRATLINGDFEQVLLMAEPQDFVYMDPPYARSSIRTFTEYDARAFSTADLTRLRHWMVRLDSHGVRFVVSYAEGSEADLLRKNFQFRSVEVRRNIAGFTHQRKRLNEILIWNF
jgi:DNA adenine methylase